MEDAGLTLQERIDLLVASGLVDGQVRELTQWLLSRIAEDYGLVLTEDNAGTFVTHVAMALQRVKRGEPLAGVPEVVDDVVQAHPHQAARAELLARHLGDELGRSLPEPEVRYLALYLCMMTEGDGANA